MTVGQDEQVLVSSRQQWLTKRKLTPRQFAESLDLDYNTVIRWFSEPRAPQRLMRERVQSKYKDFPF